MANMLDATCSAPSCDKPVLARGVCNGHYKRLIKSGSLGDRPVGTRGRPRFTWAEYLMAFWSRVDRTGECWEWQGYRQASGHGQVAMFGKRRTMQAHRFAWELENGAIPEGMNVLHRCDNPPCVRVSHLFLGTQTDNMRDMFEKGRNWRARAARVSP